MMVEYQPQYGCVRIRVFGMHSTGGLPHRILDWRLTRPPTARAIITERDTTITV